MSDYFDLEQLADGVYAAIVYPGSPAGGNSGFVNLGDGVVIFDMMASSTSAQDVIAAAQDICGQPVVAVINSHLHFDHILGNWAVPAGVDIISTSLTSELITQRVVPSLIQQRQGLPAGIQDLETRLQTEQNPQVRREMTGRIEMLRGLLHDPHEMQVRMPTRTFTDRLVFEGSQRRAELIEFAGHTESDTVLVLPDDGFIFTGDLVVHQTHPWMLECDPAAWLQTLDRLDALNPVKLVPGHGPLADRGVFGDLRDYVAAVQASAAEVVARSGSPDDVPALTVPPAFAAWRNGRMFTENVRALVRRQMA